MIGTEPKRIEVGTPEMERAFRAGVENYVPTAGGHDLQEEGGVTAGLAEEHQRAGRPLRAGPVDRDRP